MPAKKLVVSTYLQYILIGLGALLFVVFVRQLTLLAPATVGPARGGGEQAQAPDKGAKE